MAVYTREIASDDDVMTVQEFCAEIGGMFTDYDGFGYPVRDGKIDESIYITPSRSSEIPADATHIVWFNR